MEDIRMLQAYIRARSYIQARLEREEGQALVEYALILSLVVVGAVVILGILGGKISGIFTQVSNDI
jgi:Flp pilus assembly pilin Flp